MVKRRNAPNAAFDPPSPDQRWLLRKDALLDGVLADADGEAASECIIRNIHVLGASVSLERTLPISAHVVLLDTSNEAAHVARVIWSKADRAGLSFIRSYAMGPGLPHTMGFVWRLLFEAKLRQVERAVAAGVSRESAVGTIGLTKQYIRQMAPHAASDERFQRLLLSAERLPD